MKTKTRTQKKTTEGEQYLDMDKKVEIICPTHGSFFMTPRNHLNGHGCPDCGDISLITAPYIDK